jgi:hypothetical protein
VASAETVLSGAAVRGLELHKIAERRRAAGLLGPPALVDAVLGWVRQGLLPPEAVVQIILRLLENAAFTTPGGRVDRAALEEALQRCRTELGQAPDEADHLDALAKVLVRRLGDWCLEPDWLAKIIKGWAEVGALPPEAALLNEDVLRRLSAGAFFTRLGEALRVGDEKKCAELLWELQQGGRLGLCAVERRRQEAGLVGGGDDPETNFEFLLRGDFLAGEGRAEVARRALEALQARWAGMDDAALRAAVDRRKASAGPRADDGPGDADLEALALEALALQALTHRDLAGRTTGLALSGGGLRSASFNLGLLQALYRGGLLRGVDYLSTVSGGTYIGAWLSARVAQQNAPLTREDGFRPLTDRKDGSEGGAVKRLIRAGYYLNHPLVFTSRYVFGLLAVNFVLLSFLLLGCVALAGAWRLLDEPPLCESILVLTGGVVIEAYRPFLVAAVLLLAWLIGWGLAATRQNHASRALRYGVPLALLAVTAAWPVLEWHGRFLEPEHPLWRLVRPLPLVLLCAWLLAWQVTEPSAPGPRPGWRALARRAALGVLLPLGALWAARYAVGAWLALPYGAEVALTVTLVAVTVAWVGRWALRLALARPGGPPTPFQTAKRLQWLLLLSGAAFLLGWAVWFATPSINLVPTTSTAFTLPEQGTIEQHRSWLYPLLAGLIASLVPFLNPRRLLESGLQPKRFWEPWLFRLACVGAVIGVPLLAVHLFARHNLSGCNTIRSPEILPGEIDLPGFFQRVKQDVEEERPAAAGGLRLPPAPAPGSRAHWKLVDVWDDLNQRALPDGSTVRGAIDGDGPLAQVLRQQPVPLSPRAAAKKRALVEQVNAVLFPQGASPEQEEEASPENLFHPLLQRQRRIEEGKGPKAGQWASWPAIKEMLRQLEETRAVTEEDRKERRALADRVKRLVLEADYQIDTKDVPRRQNVIHPDQLARLACFVVLLGVCGLIVRRARLNASSLHTFYRDQLAWAFLASGKDGPGEPAGEQQRALSTLDTARNGGPYPLINATLNTLTVPQLILKAFGGSEGAGPAGPSGLTDCFVFGRDFVGSDTCGYAWTVRYEATSGVRLRDAVALSGAAVSLTQIDNPLLLLLMSALNLRLGQWLPSPRHHQALGQPTLARLLTDHGDPAGRRFFFVSDGGHHDNLGLGSLLKRRCRWVIVADATCDPGYGFADFCRACRQARREDGIEFFPLVPGAGDEALPLDRVRPPACQEGRPEGADGACPAPPEGPAPSAAGEADAAPKAAKDCKGRDWLSPAHYFLARVRYPGRPGARPAGKDEGPADEDVGYLIYLKPSLTGDEAVDLKGHWRANRDFPHDPTSNQFYNEDMVESYRQLGEHIGERLCAAVCGPGREDLWGLGALQFERALAEFAQVAGGAPAPAEAPPAAEPCAAPAAAPLAAAGAATSWPHGPHVPAR